MCRMLLNVTNQGSFCVIDWWRSWELIRSLVAIGGVGKGAGGWDLEVVKRWISTMSFPYSDGVGWIP